MIKLPSTFEQDRVRITSRIRTFCHAKIWPFPYDDVACWLQNFDDALDEYVALVLLNSIIVRSKSMALSGYARLFYGELLQYLKSKSLIDEATSISVWAKCIKNGSQKPKIKFIPVSTNENAESGPALLRSLSPIVKTNHKIAPLSELKNYVIILIDDFLGGGTQFTKFANENDLEMVAKNNAIIFAPLIAMEVGVAHINNKFQDIKVLPVEILPSEIKAIPKGFEHGKNSEEDIYEHYKSMQKMFPAKNWVWGLGKDEAFIPLVFEWGCPNQAPGIFWIDPPKNNPDWNKLFHRRA